MSCSTDKKGEVVLELKQGTLSLIPLERNAVRVQFAQPGAVPMQELVYTESCPVPEYKVSEDEHSLLLSMEGISVDIYTVQDSFRMAISTSEVCRGG